MTATRFSRQNNAGSRASTTWYWENLVLVVVLVLESKALYCLGLLYMGQPPYELQEAEWKKAIERPVVVITIGGDTDSARYNRCRAPC